MSATPDATPANDVRQLAGKYLSFRLADENYGVGILKVREIIALQEITPLPHMPGSVKGVINLRGKIIPVVDLRVKLGLRESPYTDHTCIVVQEVERERDGELVHVGCIVDTVNEVLNVAAEQVEPPPSFGVDVDVSCILGLAVLKERKSVVALMDIDRILSDLDVQVLDGSLDGALEETVAPAE